MPLQGLLNKEAEFTPEFIRALKILAGGKKNLFLTGRAGTGKTYLLNYFRSINLAQKQSFVVLAPTGVAAENIKGETIHRFFRFKPGHTGDMVTKLPATLSKAAMYRNLDMIIIDEVSMVRADLLDHIDKFMRLNGKPENTNIPFGGVQMVFVGDLYQLNPIVRDKEKAMFKRPGPYDGPQFFDSHAFHNIESTTEFIELKKHYRQTDPEFIKLLNAIRENAVTQEQVDQINTRYFPYVPPEKSLSIILATTNRIVNDMNTAGLNRLTNNLYRYYAVKKISGVGSQEDPADSPLCLKVGSQIMFLNNDLDDRWVNGTLGTVTSLDAQDKYIIVRRSDGKDVQVLPYVWETFESRFDTKTKKMKRNVIGTFQQYPLDLAWAVTIHKGQGKTFENIIIDTGKGAFTCGQMYVALSRCPTLEGIILKKPLMMNDIMVDQRIADFHKKHFGGVSQ